VSTVLLDEHLDGFLRYLESLTFNDTWREIAEAIELRFVRLRDVGIASATSDQGIWRFCQANGYYLLTDNRAENTADALGAVILTEGTPSSLPVFTIGDMDRFRLERSYGESLTERLLEYLLDPENVRGTGRLYLP
jgi:predicted nuclease of predicted toxin-antitoxin system